MRTPQLLLKVTLIVNALIVYALISKVNVERVISFDLSSIYKKKKSSSCSNTIIYCLYRCYKTRCDSHCLIPHSKYLCNFVRVYSFEILKESHVKESRVLMIFFSFVIFKIYFKCLKKPTLKSMMKVEKMTSLQ